MQAPNLVIPETLTIEYDNTKTIWLLVDESMKLRTKLRHVDIHSYWLRKKLQNSLIRIRLVLSKKMVDDSLTKALSRAKMQNFFARMTGIEDQKDLWASIKRGQDALQQLQTDPGYSEVYGFGADVIWYVQRYFC